MAPSPSSLRSQSDNDILDVFMNTNTSVASPSSSYNIHEAPPPRFQQQDHFLFKNESSSYELPGPKHPPQPSQLRKNAIEIDDNSSNTTSSLSEIDDDDADPDYIKIPKPKHLSIEFDGDSASNTDSSDPFHCQFLDEEVNYNVFDGERSREGGCRNNKPATTSTPARDWRFVSDEGSEEM